MELIGFIWVKNKWTSRIKKIYEKSTTSDCRLFIVINRSVASDLFGKSSLLEFQPA